jgi:hypothetical protein
MSSSSLPHLFVSLLLALLTAPLLCAGRRKPAPRPPPGPWRDRARGRDRTGRRDGAPATELAVELAPAPPQIWSTPRGGRSRRRPGGRIPYSPPSTPPPAAVVEDGGEPSSASKARPCTLCAAQPKIRRRRGFSSGWEVEWLASERSTATAVQSSGPSSAASSAEPKLVVAAAHGPRTPVQNTF